MPTVVQQSLSTQSLALVIQVAAQAGLSQDALRAECFSKYLRHEPGELSEEQAAELVKRLSQRAKAAKTKAATEQPQTAPTPAAATQSVPSPSSNVQHSPPQAPQSPPQGKPGCATADQLAQLGQLRARLFATMPPTSTDADRTATWTGILARRNVTTARDLTVEQATELISTIAHKLNEPAITQLQEGLYGSGQGQGGGDSATASPAAP
jgi:hypothetical protein